MPLAGRLLIAAGVLGAAGVALGAFGAHGLRDRLGADGLPTWQTAVTYHLIHVLALLALAAWARAGALALSGGEGREGGQRAIAIAGVAFAAGIVLFSGSLYGLALDGPRWLGPVTPLGGIAFLCGWLALPWAARSMAR